MNISAIKQLDVGMSGIVCSGVIKYEKLPRNINGETNGEPWSFWTQFVVIEDSTDSIGANVRVGGLDQKLHKGYKYTLENCKLDSYIKDNKTMLSLQGRLGPGNAPQAPSQAAGAAQSTKDVDWDAKDKRMARMGGLNNATRLICLLAEAGKIDSPDVNLITKTAELMVNYIYNGLSKPRNAVKAAAKAAEELGDHYDGSQPTPGEPNEDDIPF